MNFVNKNLYVLLFTIFLDMVGIGILIPVVPQLLGEPNSIYYLLSPERVDLGFILLGLLVASYPLSSFFAAPILGALSDRYGRKPILFISILGTALSYFVFAYAILTRNIPLLFISRIMDGVTGGNIVVAQAAIADLTHDKDRTRVFGLQGAIFGLGFVLGPFLGGVLSSHTIVPFFNASTPFIFSGFVSIINAILIYYFFQESIKEKFTKGKIRLLASIENVIRAKKFHSVKNLFIVSFLFTAGFSFYTSFFNVYLTNKFNFSAIQVGNFYAYIGFWIIITQIFIVPRLSKRFSEMESLGPAYILGGLGMLLFLFPNDSWLLLFVVPLSSIPNSVQHANFISLLTKKSDEKQRGEILGTNASINALAQSIPPIFAGVLAALFAPYVPIMIAAFFVVSAGLVFIFKYRKREIALGVHI